MSRLQFILGADLGQTNDPTALVVVEVSGQDAAARFDVRHLERHLGKPYTFIVERVKTLTERLEKLGAVEVGFDQTGVGRAVADMLRAAGISAPLYGVSITSGDASSRTGDEFHVPKKDLVAALLVPFQNGRIRIAKALPLAEMLTRELLNFKVKSRPAQTRYSRRGGPAITTISSSRSRSPCGYTAGRRATGSPGGTT